MQLEGDGGAEDETAMSQGGFRVDSELSQDDLLTVQGDAYTGEMGQRLTGDIEVEGGNLIGRWTRQLGKDSSIFFQAYYDATHRLVPGVFEEDRHTFDIEMQHRLPLFDHHDVIYGANYRVSLDDIGNLGPSLAFLPDEETVHLVSAYLQDQWSIVPDRFSIIIGSKFEYNTFSGFEIQPSGRFVWTPNEQHTVWGAISRAVRTPTRIDQDLFAPNPSTGATPVLVGNRDFDSEELLAYELGYRVRPTDTLSLEANVYYHDYSNLRSVEPRNGPGTLPLILANKRHGEAYGGAIGAKWRINDWWEVDSGLALLQTDVDRDSDSNDTGDGTAEANDPNVSFVGRSSMDLPYNLEFDTFLRYVSDLPNPSTPEYFTIDMRLGCRIMENLEVAVVGRNLLDDSHPEFRRTTFTTEVRRSVFGTIRWRF